MINKLLELLQRDSEDYTREDYLEELEMSEALERHLYDELEDSVEYGSAVIEAAIESIETPSKKKLKVVA